MSTLSTLLQHQKGPYISFCCDIIEKIEKDAAKDAQLAAVVSKAFNEINSGFKDQIETFEISKEVESELKAKSLQVFEDLQELVEIMKGESDLCPLAPCKSDGAGVVYGSFTREELLVLRSEVCKGVAFKINSTIQNLLSKREATAAEYAQIEKQKQETKKVFDARVQEATLLQTEEGALKAVSQNGLILEKLHDIFKNNKTIVLAAVKQNGRALQFAHHRLRNDNEVVIQALSHPDTDFIIQFAGENFRRNRAQLLQAINLNEMVIGYGDDAVVEDREFILEAVSRNPMCLQLLNENLRRDMEIVYKAFTRTPQPNWIYFINHFLPRDIKPEFLKLIRVKEDPSIFNQLHAYFRNLKEVAEYAVKADVKNFQHASDSLKKDESFISFALDKVQIDASEDFVQKYLPQSMQVFGKAFVGVRKNPFHLRNLQEPLKKNRLIVAKALKKNGLALGDAHEELRNDLQMVLLALNQNGLALGYASDNMRNNPVVVTAALNSKPEALQYASERLRHDRDIVKIATNQNLQCFAYAGDKLKTNEEYLAGSLKNLLYRGMIIHECFPMSIQPFCYALDAVWEDRFQPRLVDPKVFSSKVFMAEAVKKDGLRLQYATFDLSRDSSLALEAVKQNGLALQYASYGLRHEKSLVLEAVKQNGLALAYAAENILCDPQVVTAAVTNNGLALEYASDALRDDQEIVLAAVKQNGLALQYAGDECKRSEEIVLTATSQNPTAINFTVGHRGDVDEEKFLEQFYKNCEAFDKKMRKSSAL